jgi:ATP-GRASP peptide maturase of grasp-with-spasm system
MILIISIEFDQTTYEVVEWIKLLSNEEVLVLNENNSITEIFISIGNEDINDITLNTMCGDEIVLNKITSVWMRKGQIFFEEAFDSNTIDIIDKNRKNDNNIINEYIYHLLNNRHMIGEPNNTDINKFKVLKAALRCGLKIPRSLVINTRKQLEASFKNVDIVAKAISGIQFETKKFIYNSYTKIIDKITLPNNFGPSFVQENIKKKYELRIFFINDNYYTCAIFSQSNTKTAVDYRNYDNQKPNRLVPYSLPIEIKTKLMELMEELGINTGSIDMIVDDKGDYIFLEVNPVGQFGMISKPCNYFLERKTAQTLLKPLL